ncbi:MAG: DUF3857 domain-containing protein [Bacteroidia bacterium]|nr:DUF3857 domain-containing protein [Bacteroidia bacterium]
MFIKLLWSVALILAIFSTLPGKDKPKPFYPVALIDSAMRKDAWAVCRDFRQEFVLHDNGKAVEYVHLVITVLEKRGDDLAELVLPYDQSSKITSISGKNYDAAGIYNEKLKSGAIQDVNYTSEGAIYDDLRMKIAKIDSNTYPYTVEYSYEITYDGLLGYPNWYPLRDYHISVEKSSFIISYPEKMEVRYRERNLPGSCRSEKTEKGIRTLEWKIDSLQALRDEPFSPKLSQEMPGVITAPVSFEYCGTSGSMNSWHDFGQWIGQLLQNRDQLPPVRQNEIIELVKGMKDTAKIVRTLYEYMQKRTHYVGIQLGIGGFQPFPAETVDQLGYGDCKALSNYMKAILKTVGVKADYTIVGAATSQGITMTDFPTANQCNHVILCVPLKKDTIWLECTSQTTPCGYMSKFTAGRKGLVIDSRGSRIVAIPLLSAEQSSQHRKAVVSLSTDGRMEAKVKTEYSGYQYDNISKVLTESKKEQEKALYENLAVAGMKISDFTYQDNKERIPEATESIALTSQTYAARSGTRIFVPVNIFNQIKSIPSHLDNRKMPVYREFAFLDTDSVTFYLPKGYKPESFPRGKNLKTAFGEYCSTLTVNNDQVLYTRRFKMNRGTWPKEDYAALVDFYTAVVGADKVKLVIKEESQ